MSDRSSLSLSSFVSVAGRCDVLLTWTVEVEEESLRRARNGFPTNVRLPPPEPMHPRFRLKQSNPINNKSLDLIENGQSAVVQNAGCRPTFRYGRRHIATPFPESPPGEISVFLEQASANQRWQVPYTTWQSANRYKPQTHGRPGGVPSGIPKRIERICGLRGALASRLQ